MAVHPTGVTLRFTSAGDFFVIFLREHGAHMTVYRIHIRPKGGLANPEVSFAYCLKEGVLGLGWQTEIQNNDASWEEYEAEAIRIYGNDALSRVRYLKNNIKKNDLVWTRDTEGNYYFREPWEPWGRP